MASRSVIVNSVGSVRTSMLWPAPNVNDWEYISRATSMDIIPPIASPEEITFPLKILTDYRGSLLFVEGGIQIFRVHGSIYYPIAGTDEEVYISINGTTYTAFVNFV